ncbi:uncharacterized protein LOC114131096 [Aphis gossypii]|uniref:Uncharacterized protein n=1 Tax=Aphis gossypii TaxID=80765 RepID=A0A9P0NQX3_APHGO|nr:uncharacterized protein LOC114131096 [Aphis gossypii]CAH1736299.1 unnamed protein product [Aphis gossypii]
MKNFIILLTHFVLQNQWITITAHAPDFGKSPCMYAGDFDKYGTYCAQTPMPLEELPDECTSLVYDGIIYGPNDEKKFSFQDTETINSLNGSGKPLILYYGYTTQKLWINAVDPANAQKEAIKLTGDTAEYTISGLVLTKLNYDFTNKKLDFHYNESFYENLVEFVCLLKSNHSDWSIGLYVSARNMIYYHEEDPCSTDKFDFSILNKAFDFYVIGFELFNPCNNIFKQGIVPMTNVFRSKFSLQTLEVVLSDTDMDTDQIYLEFKAMPTKNETSKEELPKCCLTFKKFCEGDHYNTYWCADNAAAYYSKGQFAKKIGAKGFITKYIDTIDPTVKCKCNNDKFITFAMMLRGFLDQDPITDCEKLNSISLT